ncbi:hypothetical protein AYI69_g3032 [Smittium culicis]|uniref:Reverse transcriptase domain-containing protein n=1 Tax=Smittium culicis TaxID=133412 RepID=A0A1R1YKT2_9FUNG|nr:hypothetical protein AYI69_g3032 [Smittium culicis]
METKYCGAYIQKKCDLKGLCRSPKLIVKIGNEISEKSDYNFGVRQGCPTSPILFNFYINDIFDGIQGVFVPSLGKRIPGQIFANDAEAIADSAEQLQVALDKISDWSNKQKI